MKQFRKTHLAVFAVIILGSCLFPSTSEAQYGWGDRQSSYKNQINDLDDEIVEEFAIPVLFGVTLKSINPDFGAPRGGGTRSHEGQDMAAVLGTPIVSPTEAVVTGVGYGESAGNYVYTANPGGESFRYMHLDEIADIKGRDVLKVGDFIGTVGDTGNAVGAGAHLHFEVKKGEAQDPYPRIAKEFTLKEKMSYVVRMFKDLKNEDEMAEFLVANYPTDFRNALNAGLTLPTEIKAELKKEGIVNVSSLLAKLEEIIESIPKFLTKNIAAGDTGTEVSLLQVYLIQQKTGEAGAKLALAGSTGYFGSVTEAALREYQEEADITVTGVYDAATRNEMLK